MLALVIIMVNSHLLLIVTSLDGERASPESYVMDSAVGPVDGN